MEVDGGGAVSGKGYDGGGRISGGGTSILNRNGDTADSFYRWRNYYRINKTLPDMVRFLLSNTATKTIKATLPYCDVLFWD